MKTAKNLFVQPILATIALLALATLPAAGADRYWQGASSAGAYADFRTASNWSSSTTPKNGDSVYFKDQSSTVYVNLDRNSDVAAAGGTYAYVYHNIDNSTVYFTTTNSAGELVTWQPYSINVYNGGKLILNGVNLSRRNSPYFTFGPSTIDFAPGSTNILQSYNNNDIYTGDPAGDWTLTVIGDRNLTFSGNNANFTGKIVSRTTGTGNKKDQFGVYFNNGTASSFPNGSLEIASDGRVRIAAQSGEVSIGELTGAGTLQVDAGTDGVELVLALGGKNTDFTCGVSFSRYASSSAEASVRKTGTGAMDYQIALCRNLYIDEGKVAMVTSGRTPDANIVFGGGALADTAEGTLVDVSAKIKNSASPIVVDIANAATFATALASSNKGGLVKRGAGSLQLSAAPAYSGTTTIEAGNLVVCGGTTIAELSVTGENSYLVVIGETGDSVTVTSFAEGTTQDNVRAASGFSLEWSGNTATITKSNDPFTWTNATGDGKWTTPGNWSIGSIAADTLPTAADTVEFPAAATEWSVVLPANVSVAKVVAEGDTRISGGGQITCNLYQGNGKIALDNVNLYRNGADIVFNNNLEIAGTTIVSLAADKNSCYNFHLYGDLTGSGTLDVRMHKSGGTDCGAKFHGDNREFRGTFESTVYYARNGVKFDNYKCASANAVWHMNNDSPSSNTETALFQNGTDTYCFGAYIGSMKSGSTPRKVEFGGRSDVDTVVTLVNRHTSSNGRQGGFDVTKVGSGLATFWSGTANGSPSTDAIENLDIQGGTVLLPQTVPMTALKFTGDGGVLRTGYTTASEETDDGTVYTYTPIDPSAVIKNSTAAIVFDDDGTNRTWATALAASNTGGFVKRGAGTLTLAEAPLYEGYTVVEEGALVIGGEEQFNMANVKIRVADPAAYGAATIDPADRHAFVYARNPVGRPILETTGGDDATAKKYATARTRTTVTIDGVEYYGFTIAPNAGFIMRFR